MAVAFEGVAIEFADARRKRTERWRDAFRKLDVPEPFENELPREVIVGAVGKGQFDQGEPEDGSGTPRNDMRRVIESALDGDRDLLFHFLGSKSGVHGDDDHVGIGYVRIGFDLELQKGPDASGRDDQPGHHNDERAGERKFEESRQHGLSSVSGAPRRR